MPGAKKGNKQGSGGGAGVALLLCLLAALIALVLFLYRQQGWLLSPPSPTSAPSPTSESSPPPDTEPPVIEGPHDLTVAVGMTLSYRSGVSAVDAVDGLVPFQIDASAVNLSQAGKYPVIYRAEDKSGNRAETTVTVTVVEVSGVNDDDPTADVSGAVEPSFPPLPEVTQEMVDEVSDQILAKIVTPSMSQWEQARAIYNYVHTHVKYVGSADKSSWLIGAYVGFTRNRGDCYNYFACSKALLTRAGIPNVDLYRVGGGTDHYWQLVNVGNGWYHFDACPHPDSYPLNSFLLDEMAVREYTEKCAPIRSNYYVYDYENCPVVPVGTSLEELPQESESVEVTADPLGEQSQDPEDGEALLPPGVLEATSPEPSMSAGPEPTVQPPAELPAEPIQAPAEELSDGPTQDPAVLPPGEAVPSPAPADTPTPVPETEAPLPEEVPPAEIEIPGKEDLL